MIDNNDLDKILSNKTHQKSDGLRLTASANANKLFENYAFAWRHQDGNNNSNFIEIHRAVASLKFNNMGIEALSATAHILLIFLFIETLQFLLEFRD